MRQARQIRIGVSGWTYAPWRGAFYPKGLPQHGELAYAAARFNSLEINGTFYGMQTPRSFARWADAVPDDFVFAVKGPRYITHLLRLKDIATPLANFFASGPLALGPRLGPILWQFPARFAYDAALMESFFTQLPHTLSAAAALGEEHDTRLRAPAFLDIADDQPLRHAVEIRHESFATPAFIAQLRRHDVALVTADTVDWPCLMDLTAGFAYCRLHGNQELYRSAYSEAELDRWAARAAAWHDGTPMTDGNFVTPPRRDGKRRDVFIYFDNTDKLAAPGNALALMQRLGLGATERHKYERAT